METSEESPHGAALRRAVQIYKARRSRSSLFDSDADLFGEPAWDILLDLYIAHERQHPVCLSDASLGAGVPVSTAQRWVRQLLSRGLLQRKEDDQDARRVLVSLSDKALEVMRIYLEKHDRGSSADDNFMPFFGAR